MFHVVLASADKGPRKVVIEDWLTDFFDEEVSPHVTRSCTVVAGRRKN